MSESAADSQRAVTAQNHDGRLLLIEERLFRLHEDYREDHSRLRKIEEVLVKLSTLLEAQPRTAADHEERIRAVEQWQQNFAGRLAAAGVVGAVLGSALVTIILHALKLG